MASVVSGTNASSVHASCCPVSCPCMLCSKTNLFASSQPRIKTTKLCALILRSLMSLKPEKEFYNLKEDIYVFISQHWSLLSKLKQFKNKAWKKSLLDAFNHCNLIESGKDIIQGRGYYRLRSGCTDDDANYFEHEKSVEDTATLNKKEGEEEEGEENNEEHKNHFDYQSMRQNLDDLEKQMKVTLRLIETMGYPTMNHPDGYIGTKLVAEDHYNFINNMEYFKTAIQEY